MFINSIPLGSISTNVWNAVTRTLTADPATSGGAATLVWALGTRKLTGFGPCIAVSSILNTNVLTSVLVTFPPAASVNRAITIGVVPGGGAGTLSIGLYDGTTQFSQVNVLAAAKGAMTFAATNSTCMAYLFNGNANTSTYGAAISDEVI